MIPGNIEENLHYIELFTKKKIRNPLVGNHISLLKGHGYDFWDHKKYEFGDDTRKIDWNATARMGYTSSRIPMRRRTLTFSWQRIYPTP